MDQVCALVDFEGFTVHLVNKDSGRYSAKFLIRELAYTRISNSVVNDVYVIRFDLSSFRNESFIKDDLQTIRHQEKFIHGLPFKPTTRERTSSVLRPHSQATDIIREIYSECHSDHRSIVAYKGGSFEKSILDELGIPNLNLEKHGCPSYGSLYESDPSYAGMVCGHHNNLVGRARYKPIHCAKSEVAAYRDWIMSE